MRNAIIILLFPLLSASQSTVDSMGNIIQYVKQVDSVKYFASKYRADSIINGLVSFITTQAANKLNTSDTANMVAGYVRKNTIIPFASGGISASAATSATTGVMTVNMTSSMITITPTGACTFNASGGTTGQRVTFLITTSGTTSFVLTFGTNFRKVGTLATGTVSARFFSVTFICINGTTWQEIARTAVQT